ncbi:MAG: cbb3-type cytochrome c oxidase subunit I [Salinisphaera sp.]|jgi:cytochrome c oxidase cbb3-type subunit 1|nr:cbb3-type cytochrome c oxidase subunit I [Salinisphaera sp.]
MVGNSILLPSKRPLVVSKSSVEVEPEADAAWVRLIYAYIAFATFWLLLGTLAGEYLGLKFVWPDIDHIAWLSFGRLRPVHTNTVFWGWASLAMIALALYVVPKTSQRRLYSLPLAWFSLVLINVSVLAGDLLLMAGINNAAQEYREYIWPAMGLFVAGIIVLAYDLVRTIIDRAVEEIYISNWYIMGGFLWTIALMVIAYIPTYQRTGISETVIQGFYMHMGVGMWFTPIVLGLTYYFLPKLLNKPIYSYSLGVLAFWTQMVFYSMLGAHHFIYAPTPWALQTIAIIFSVGMVVTLVAGTGNFLMTMKGSFHAVGRSYSLPFILVGVISYFVFSLQGTFEAFRSSNHLWDFTNYTIAHSHLTMYGFVVFLIWGGIYGLLPRLTGREPSQLLIGVHFWFALVGLALYSIALMIGGTLQGLSWMSDAPFIKSVILMAPFYLWRAIGGTLMFLSHLIFAYNIWCMRPGQLHVDEAAAQRAAV